MRSISSESNMKTLKNLFIFGSCLVVSTAISARAQTFDLSWVSIDGGGGTSSGGAYSVSGTIGQPDAGVLSGGNYTLVGGFWSSHRCRARQSRESPVRRHRPLDILGREQLGRARLRWHAGISPSRSTS